MTTWKELIVDEMEENGDSWDNIVAANIAKPIENWHDDEAIAKMPEPSFEREFDNGYGGTNGDKFLVWTDKFVYFPVCYDGAEWVGCVPRNPEKDVVADHVGGG